jgi:SulP family sulfate permease
MTPARFRPRLLDALKGYDRRRFFADLGAGATVGIVALPLAMAFAIASGVKPEQGIWTAIVAGFLISALGGSQVQIGGPAGAFIVIVYGIVQRHGVGGLLTATAMAGVLMFLLGWLRLGALVRYIPVSIVVGFTNGIAVLIALSQLKDLLGLKTGKVGADFFSQVLALAAHIGETQPAALGLGAICVIGLFAWPRLFAHGSPLPDRMRTIGPVQLAGRMPGPIVALVTLTVAAAWLKLPVETIGMRFGEIPRGLPPVEWPEASWIGLQQLLVPALTIAVLGAIESLLCARVADTLITAKRHDPNQELMAQGIANAVVPFIGGIPATGTIARTVTNVRAGAASPVAGMAHALTLLGVVLVAAPWAAHVPLAVLAGILLYVAANMGEWSAFVHLRRQAPEYRAKLLVTFILTVVVDLTVAVEVGLLLAFVFFVYRMGTLFGVAVEPGAPAGVRVCRLYGALFFGALTKLEAIGEDLPAGTRAVVLEMHQLVSIDASGLDALAQLHRNLDRDGILLVFSAVNEQPLALIRQSGFDAVLGDANFVADVPSALALVAREPAPSAEPSIS